MLTQTRHKITWFLLALVVALSLLFSTPLIGPAHADCVPADGINCPTGGGG